MALKGIEDALDALDEPKAAPLDPEAEERLYALLAERVAPLLLRCLQTWEGGVGASGRLCFGAACLQRGRPAPVFLCRAPCGCTACAALGFLLSACACRCGLQSTGGLADALRGACRRAVSVHAIPIFAAAIPRSWACQCRPRAGTCDRRSATSLQPAHWVGVLQAS